MTHKIKVKYDIGDNYYPWVYNAYNAIPFDQLVLGPRDDFCQYYKCKFVDGTMENEFIEFNNDDDAVIFTLSWVK